MVSLGRVEVPAQCVGSAAEQHPVEFGRDGVVAEGREGREFGRRPRSDEVVRKRFELLCGTWSLGGGLIGLVCWRGAFGVTDGEEGVDVGPVPLRRRIGFLAEEAGLVGSVVTGGSNPEEVDADTVGLGDLHADADVFVAREEDRVRDGLIAREFDEVRDDEGIDAFLSS